LAYADDVNIVAENIDTIQRNTKALLDARKEVGLEVNPEKTKYMLVSRCQKAGQRQSIKIGNRSFENVAKFKYVRVYKVLVGKPEGKRPLGRPRRRWEDGIRMYLREIGLGGGDWIRLSQDRDRWRAVVRAVMNLRVLAPQS
jgi:hypothetical protein